MRIPTLSIVTTWIRTKTSGTTENSLSRDFWYRGSANHSIWPSPRAESDASRGISPHPSVLNQIVGIAKETDEDFSPSAR